MQGVGGGEAPPGPAAVRAEAEGGALLVAALLRCMQPAAQGDPDVQARWGSAVPTGCLIQVLLYLLKEKARLCKPGMRVHVVKVH